MRHSPGMTFSRAIRSTFFASRMRPITRRIPTSWRAKGSRECAPDDGLREANHNLSFRGDAKHRTRNLEIPRCAIAHLRSGASAPSRNDGVWIVLAPDFAEPVIGRRFAPTRWLYPGYDAGSPAFAGDDGKAASTPASCGVN